MTAHLYTRMKALVVTNPGPVQCTACLQQRIKQRSVGWSCPNTGGRRKCQKTPLIYHVRSLPNCPKTITGVKTQDFTSITRGLSDGVLTILDFAKFEMLVFRRNIYRPEQDCADAMLTWVCISRTDPCQLGRARIPRAAQFRFRDSFGPNFGTYST